MTASGSWGFLETVLEAHLEMAFDLSVVQNGFMFSIIGISFSLVSAFIHRIINQVGRGNSMTIGLLLISLSFLILGPVPALKEMINTMNEAWASVIVPLVFIGAGTGLVLAPAFSFLSDVMPSEDNVLASGCFITSIELGEVLGPMTGGMAMDKLPQLADIFCLRPDLDCTCGFSWSCTTFSIVNLVIMFLVLGGSVLSSRLESLRKEEQRSKDFENILSGRSFTSQDARIKELSEKFGDLPMNVQFTV
jgi:MFS family permease